MLEQGDTAGSQRIAAAWRYPRLMCRLPPLFTSPLRATLHNSLSHRGLAFSSNVRLFHSPQHAGLAAHRRKPMIKATYRTLPNRRTMRLCLHPTQGAVVCMYFYVALFAFGSPLNEDNFIYLNYTYRRDTSHLMDHLPTIMSANNKTAYELVLHSQFQKKNQRL